LRDGYESGDPKGVSKNTLFSLKTPFGATHLLFELHFVSILQKNQ